MVATSSIKINSSMIDDFLTPVSDEENKNKYLKVNENNKIVYSSYDEIVADIETSGLDEKFNEINNRIDEEVLNLNNTISLETSKLESKDNYLETYIKNVETSAEEDADLFDAKINEINQTITDNYNTLDTKINSSVNDINSSITELDNKYVHLTGDEEIDGNKKFINSVNAKGFGANTNVNPDVDSEESEDSVLIMRDNNENIRSQINLEQNSNDFHELRLRNISKNDKKWTDVRLRTTSDGKYKAYYSGFEGTSLEFNSDMDIPNIGYFKDINQSDSLVHRNGNETINGTKTFNNDIVLQNKGITHKMTSFDSTDESANGNIVIFQSTDKNNKMTSQLHNLVNYGADNNRLCFEVNRTVGSENYNAALQFYIDKDNHFGLSATTNSSATGYSSNNNDALNKASSSISDNSFGTKGWVNNPLKSTNVVHKTGDESIGGNKTFTGTVKVPTASVSSNDTSSVNTAYINTKFQKVNVLPANPDPNVYYFIPEV